MNLEQYLEQLKNCPDNKLTSRLGVYDNYPVVLKIDFDLAGLKLFKLPRLTHFESKNDLIQVEVFNYDDAVHVLRLHNRKYNSVIGIDKKIKEKLDKDNFNCFFFIHPYQVKEGFHENRKMADMIIYLSENFLIKNKIPAFFPVSSGYSMNSNKLVFYELGTYQ